MSRSIRKETSSLAFGIVGRFGGSSAGFVVAALNAASAASREVVVLRVLSAGILSSPKGFTFLNANWTTVTMKWITLGSGPGGCRALARRFNFSQASLCNAFLWILEVFSRYGNSHGPGAGTHTSAGPPSLGRVSGNLHEAVTFAAIAALAGFRSRR